MEAGVQGLSSSHELRADELRNALVVANVRLFILVLVITGAETVIVLVLIRRFLCLHLCALVRRRPQRALYFNQAQPRFLHALLFLFVTHR